jgi:hypothetical protein
MLRLLSDENFNNDIVRGLRLKRPEIDIARAQDVIAEGAADPAVLAWAAGDNRIVVTHDRATFPDHAHHRVLDGETMPGVFIVGDRLPVARVIDELLLLDEASNMAEWAGRVLFLPL